MAHQKESDDLTRTEDDIIERESKERKDMKGEPLAYSISKISLSEN